MKPLDEAVIQKKQLEEFPLIAPDGKLVTFESYTHEPSNDLKKLSEKASAANKYLLAICAAEQAYNEMMAMFDE